MPGQRSREYYNERNDEPRNRRQSDDSVYRISPGTDASEATLKVKSVVTAGVFLVGAAVSIFGVWMKMNQDMQADRLAFLAFKETMVAEVANLKSDIKEIKSSITQTQAADAKSIVDMERRVQDLDSSVTQIYQKMVSEK